MSQQSFNIKRRFLLQQLGLIGGAYVVRSPLEMLTRSLVGSIIQRAFAEEMNVKSKNYIYFNLYGAPPRWHYDLILKTNESDPVISNKTVSTSYTSDGRNTQYSTTNLSKNGYNLKLPYLWAVDIPSLDMGGKISPKNILDNWLHIRGVDMQSDGHNENEVRQQLPVSGGNSLYGQVADYASSPINAINMWSKRLPFINSKKSAAQHVGFAKDKNLLSQNILKNFIHNSPPNMQLLKKDHNAALESSIAAINSHTDQGLPGASVLKKDRAYAEFLLRQAFTDVGDFWNSTLAKYNQLIRRALAPNSVIAPQYADIYPGGIPNISNMSLGLDPSLRTNNGAYSSNYSDGDQIVEIVSNLDLRTMITTNTEIPTLAETFTIAEYLFRNGLCASITSTIENSLHNIVLTENGQSYVTSLFHDQHSTGHMIGVYLNFFFFRAFQTCLNEFIRVLKTTTVKGTLNQTLFNDTLIHVGAEFNRSARNNGSGADHGFGAQSISLYSGAIKGPQVIGNIYNTSDASTDSARTYAGTWGESAPTQLLNSNQSFNIHIDHVGETILSLLGLPGISKNAFALVNADGTPRTKPAQVIGR